MRKLCNNIGVLVFLSLIIACKGSPKADSSHKAFLMGRELVGLINYHKEINGEFPEELEDLKEYVEQHNWDKYVKGKWIYSKPRAK